MSNSITKYNTENIYFSPIEEKIGNVRNSKFEVYRVPLEQEDPICLETLGSIQQERFTNSMDFYVCVVRENNRFFFFEGSKFIEAFLRNQNKMKNPLTKQPIGDFEVLVSCKSSVLFQTFGMKNDLETYPYYLPILWNDHTRTINEKLDSLNRMGECFFHGEGITKALDLAIYFCEKSAYLGFKRSQHNLCIFYQRLGMKRCSLYWAIKFIGKENNSLQKNLSCAGFFELGEYVTRNFSISAYYYKQSSILGNFHGIANLILFYENGIGLSKNSQKASLWRSFLPQEWQDKDMFSFIEHLKQTNYDYNQTQQLDLPPELLEDEPGICAPNADELFPEIKADLDRRITPENLYHFSWEELEHIKQQGASESNPQDLALMQNKV